MKISEARTVLNTAAANAGDNTVYTDAFKDQAITTIGDELARECDLTQAVMQVTLAEGDDELPDLDDDFRRERMRDQPYLTGENVTITPGSRSGTRGQEIGQEGPIEVWDFAELVAQAQLNPDVDGQPVALAWDTPTTGRCFPVPDDDYTLNLPWVPPFTAWSPGVALLLVTLAGTNNHIASVSVISGGAGYLTAPALTFANAGSGSAATATATIAGGRITAVSVGAGGSGYATTVTAAVNGHDASDQTLNIPADYLRRALITGGTAILQFSDLKRRFGSSNWQRYQELLAELKGQTQAPRRRKLKPRDGWNWGGSRGRGC